MGGVNECGAPRARDRVVHERRWRRTWAQKLAYSTGISKGEACHDGSGVTTIAAAEQGHVFLPAASSRPRCRRCARRSRYGGTLRTVPPWRGGAPATARGAVDGPQRRDRKQ